MNVTNWMPEYHGASYETPFEIKAVIAHEEVAVLEDAPVQEWLGQTGVSATGLYVRLK